MKKAAKNPLSRIKKKHFFALVVAAIIGFAVFGDKGLIDVYKLKKELGGILSYNKGFEKENRDLAKTIGLLKSDKRYMEHIAKNELGMLGKDELLYRIKEALPDLPAAGDTRR
ncbi:MAG: septum formation initiator family protein [Deltaproteobacteria bacterium]|nr:septum formation initiator family protein [Deltaproteobacteria bacterium]